MSTLQASLNDQSQSPDIPTHSSSTEMTDFFNQSTNLNTQSLSPAPDISTHLLHPESINCY
jgi:hypothetical protein